MSSLSLSLSNLLQSSNAQSLASGPSAVLATQSRVSASASTGNANPTQISQVGQLFNNLQTIQETNPGQFQQLLAGIASQMSSLATELGISTSQGQYLSQLSVEFQNVASGGDLAQLLPISPTAQSLAAQAYLKASSNSDSLQALLSTVNASGTPSSAPLQSSAATDRVYGNSSSSVFSLFQSIFQQVQQVVSSTTSSAPSS